MFCHLKSNNCLPRQYLAIDVARPVIQGNFIRTVFLRRILQSLLGCGIAYFAANDWTRGTSKNTDFAISYFAV